MIKIFGTYVQSPFCCPICYKSLAQVETSLKCAGSHTFDIAREGYVNLLVFKKKPKLLGDTKKMLAARRAFLA